MIAGEIQMIGIGLINQAALVERLGQAHAHGQFAALVGAELVLALRQGELLRACGGGAGA